MTTATTTLQTRNPEWGFFGTIERAGESAETVWPIAFEAIQDATGAHDEKAYGPEGVRDFLDSRDGRHFADQLASIIATAPGGHITLQSAIAKTIEKYQTRKIGRSQSRETGIPAGLPYLTGMVQHYAIAADMNENA